MELIGTGMKKIYKYAALVCASTAVAISCVEENLEPVIPALDGDEIVFGVRAGFEDSKPGTKTVYTGNSYTLYYDKDGKLVSDEVEGGSKRTFEGINWVENDKIEIFSPQAENPIASESRPNSTHYVVTNLNDNEAADENGVLKHFAKLMNVGGAGLRWNGDVAHDFYAMYPSSEMFRIAGENGTPGEIPVTISSGIKMGRHETSNKISVFGIIPTSQQPKSIKKPTEEYNGYIAEPDMDYAYMVAKTTGITRESAAVRLSFVPIVTAVEIELENVSGESLSIGEIKVASTKQISGGFTVNLEDWTNKPYPDCTNITMNIPEGETDEIQITTRQEIDGTYQPISLSNGQTLKFTVFLLPGADIADLIVRVSSQGVGYTSRNLIGANIKKNLKTRITGLHLPKKEDFNNSGNEWMEQLPLETQMKALSLPGTGGSFTYNINEETIPSGTKVEWYKQQTLDFEAQWEQGIRVFEIVSEVGWESGWLGGDVINLASSAIRCNKQPINDIGNVNGVSYGNTVGDAYRCILRQIQEYPTETAVVILTYQPLSNNPSRNATYYAQSLDMMLNTLKTEGFTDMLDVTYSPALTMEKAKGHLMTIVRITQNDENDGGTFSAASNALNTQNVLLVDGCGTGKDKWGARGYKITQNKASFVQGAMSDPGLFQPNRLGWDPNNKQYTNNEKNVILAPDISNEISSNNNLNLGLSTTSRPSSLDATRTGYDVFGSYVEEFMTKENTYIFSNNSNTYSIPTVSGSTIAVTRPTLNNSETLNFGYDTNAGYICWFQEWSRVVKTNTFLNGNTWTDTFNGYSQSYTPIYWFESYTEKLSNIITTFDMAISGNYTNNENQANNYVFINSLCGYLVDQTIPDSTIPSVGGAYGGAAGNIKGLSDDLNPAFYNHVVNSGMESKTGPTGIILMDYVSDEESAGGSYYLPGAIIANNSKFDNNNIGGGLGDGVAGDKVIPF